MRNTGGLATYDHLVESVPPTPTPTMPVGLTIVSTQMISASGEVLCWKIQGPVTVDPVIRKTWKGRPLRTESDRLEMPAPPFPPESDYE